MLLSHDDVNFISADNVRIQMQAKAIGLGGFLGFVGLDIFIIMIAIVGWRLLWVTSGCLTVHRINTSSDKEYLSVAIDSRQSVFSIIQCIHDIVKNLVWLNGYVVKQCGYEAFCYLYFVRRLLQLMGILVFTDLTIWFPYMAYFSAEGLSLNSMVSTGNDLFRTIYTLWVGTVLLYGLQDMRIYLQMHLKYVLFRCDRNEALLNNLFSKTVNIQFLDKNINADEARLKLLNQFNIQDRIICITGVPDFSKELQIEYKDEIKNIIQRMGMENFSAFWRFFKEKDLVILENQLKNEREALKNYWREYGDEVGVIPPNSFFVTFNSIETVQRICADFNTASAVLNLCPEFGYSEETGFGEMKMMVKWSQDSSDLICINMRSHTVQLCKFLAFNLLCLGLLFLSLLFTLLNSSSYKLVKLPKVLLPAFVSIVNVTIRALIAKSSEWENRTLMSELQIRQFKVMSVYLIINVLIGSILRDTLNVLDVLQTGWGWIQVASLFYTNVDGLFYYLLILNETAFSFETSLVKTVDLLFDCFQVKLYYQKLKLKTQSKYGVNETFRFGQYYAIDFIVLCIVILYSTSCPLIHVVGAIFFLVRLYTGCYCLTVLHRRVETCSNLRLFDKVLDFVQAIILFWLLLTGATMLFERYYSNVIVLFLYAGSAIYYLYMFVEPLSLKDSQTDRMLHEGNLKEIIGKWIDRYSQILSSSYQLSQTFIPV